MKKQRDDRCEKKDLSTEELEKITGGFYSGRVKGENICYPLYGVSPLPFDPVITFYGIMPGDLFDEAAGKADGISAIKSDSISIVE